MSDLRSRLLAAVMGNPAAQDTRNAASRCDGVTLFNSLQNPDVTPLSSVTPELSRKISAVTPSHQDSGNQIRQETNNAPPYPGGLGTTYCRGLATLRERCPEVVEEHRWCEAIADADSFLARWAEQAEALGWTARNLFGLPPVPGKPAPNYQLLSRYDETGLIWLLGGRPVVALTVHSASIQHASGAITVYRKDNKPAYGPVGDSLDHLDPWGAK
jgi:hypothetical protein